MPKEINRTELVHLVIACPHKMADEPPRGKVSAVISAAALLDEEYAVLDALCAMPSATEATPIAEEAGIPKGKVVWILRRLEQRGYAKRWTPQRAYKCSAMWSVTPEGRKVATTPTGVSA